LFGRGIDEDGLALENFEEYGNGLLEEGGIVGALTPDVDIVAKFLRRYAFHSEV
jgi:hypothetical protein